MTVAVGANLHEVLEATWPPEEERELGCLTVCRSPGGGKRVTSARANPGSAPTDNELARANAQMTQWGQSLLYKIRDENEALDVCLNRRGYGIVDPTILYACALKPLLSIEAPRLSCFSIWPMLAVQTDIWAEAGIGADRIAVMHRAPGARTSLLGRAEDRPAATAFVACHRGVAMLHALEVRPALRRQGVARRVMSFAAKWAAEQGCNHLALAVTEANAPARALYASLGMAPVGRYHYRMQSPETS